MLVLHRLVVPALLLPLLATGAVAGQRLSPAQPLPPGATAGRDAAESQQGICVLGVNGPDAATGAENVVYYDGTDNWLSRLTLNRTVCNTCSLGTQGVLEAAHVSLFFPTAPCTMTVRVRVVRNFALEECPFPDGFSLVNNNPACEFTSTLYADAEDINTVKEFTIPFPTTACTILPNLTTFLEINFTSINEAARDSLVRPRIMPWNQKLPCYSYNRYEGNRFGADITASSDIDMNNAKIWADILYCESVATVRRTWGQLKQIYR
jgi:hypothetical protein